MSTEKPVKLSAALPKDVKLNGLYTIHGQAARYGHSYFIASTVAPEVLERPDGVRQPKLAIDHIEGLPTGELAKAAAQLMAWARAEREGDTQAALISKGDLLATIRGAGQTDAEED